MIESLLYFVDLYNVHRADFGVYPYSLLELVAFSVQVVGMEHIVCLQALDPEAPIFLQQPPRSTTCPNNPIFRHLTNRLSELATARTASSFLEFLAILVRDQRLEQVLSHCLSARARQLCRISGIPFMVDPRHATRELRFIDRGAFFYITCGP